MVRADKVVICAGMWRRNVAAELNWSVPLHAAEHFYVVTEPIPGLPRDLPTIRDMDAKVYAKPDAGKLLVGFFETHSKPWGMDGIPPDFSFDSLPDHVRLSAYRCWRRSDCNSISTIPKASPRTTASCWGPCPTLPAFRRHGF